MMLTRTESGMQGFNYAAAGQQIGTSQARDQRNAIPYKREYSWITKRVTAAILLQQVSYWWEHCGRRPFYKFREPCEHDWYKQDQSWTEELGFSGAEFDTALKTIGTKITTGVSKSGAFRDTRKIESLVIYWTDSNRVTWYQLNEPFFYALLGFAYNRPELLGNSGKLNYLDDSTIREYLDSDTFLNYLSTETTTETTTEIVEEGLPSSTPPSGTREPKRPKERKPRTPSLWNTQRHELGKVFEEQTRIGYQGMTVKVVQLRWWNPLKAIFTAAHEDMELTKRLIVVAIEKARKEKLTLASPQSIEQIAISLSPTISVPGKPAKRTIVYTDPVTGERVQTEAIA